MIAVVAFHGGALSGGFIGVDVFFAISGYLITGLALSEIESEGRLDLTGFWVRRARRLLPALFLVVAATLAAVAIAGRFFGTDVAPPGLGSDVLATLAYVANWTRAFGGDAYFDAYEAPSLFQHTWSLAVEEQFYIAWPLVLVATVAIVTKRGLALRPAIGAMAGAFAILSTVWTTWLAAAGPPFDRLYFGTDTRAVGLAAGCAVACATTRGHRTGDRPTSPILTTAAVVAVVILVGLATTLDGGERWLYGPGFAVIAVASVTVIDAASRSGPVATVLALRPLPAIGRVSYGIYLWHWPTIVILDRERTGLDGAAIWILWTTVTAVATFGSWRLVERRAPAPDAGRRILAYATVPAMLLGVVPVVEATKPDVDPSFTTATTTAIVPDDTLASTGTTGSGQSAAVAVTDSIAIPPAGHESTDPIAISPGRLGDDGPIRILLLGDSVAQSLGEAPPATFDGRSVEVVNGGIVACPVHPTGEWRYDNGSVVADPPECEGDDRFDAIVDEVRPHVVITMFGWPGTIAGRALDDGRTVTACDPAHDRLWADGFVEIAERFADRSIVVVPTVAPPQRFVDPDQSERPECLDAALRSTGLRLVEWSEWLCPAGDCANAAALRRDPVHFADDPEIRAIVWDALIRQSLDAAVR